MMRPRLQGTQGNSQDESKVEMLLIDQSNPDYSRIKKICKYSFKILFKLFTFVCAGSSFCMWAFSSFSEWGLLFIAVHGLLITVAFQVEHRL